MNREHLENLVELELEGALDGVQRAELEALCINPEAARWREAELRLVGLLRSIGPAEVPADIHTKVRRRIEAEDAQARPIAAYVDTGANPFATFQKSRARPARPKSFLGAFFSSGILSGAIALAMGGIIVYQATLLYRREHQPTEVAMVAPGPEPTPFAVAAAEPEPTMEVESKTVAVAVAVEGVSALTPAKGAPVGVEVASAPADAASTPPEISKDGELAHPPSVTESFRDKYKVQEPEEAIKEKKAAELAAASAREAAKERAADNSDEPDADDIRKAIQAQAKEPHGPNPISVASAGENRTAKAAPADPNDESAIAAASAQSRSVITTAGSPRGAVVTPQAVATQPVNPSPKLAAEAPKAVASVVVPSDKSAGGKTFPVSALNGDAQPQPTVAEIDFLKRAEMQIAKSGGQNLKRKSVENNPGLSVVQFQITGDKMKSLAGEFGKMGIDKSEKPRSSGEGNYYIVKSAKAGVSGADLKQGDAPLDVEVYLKKSAANSASTSESTKPKVKVPATKKSSNLKK